LRIVSRRISFVTIATFGLAGFVALAVGVTLYVSGIAGVRSTQSLISERAEALLNNLERRIDSRLKPVSDQAEWIAELIAKGRVDIDDLEHLDGVMFGALGTTPQIRSLALIRPDGKVRRWLRNEVLAVSEDWAERGNFGRLIEQAQTRSGGQWLPPARSLTSRQFVLIHHTPLRVGERFIGVLSQVVPVFRLSSDMALIGLESHSTPFVLYGAEHVLAHPSQAADDVQEIDGPLPRIGTLGDPVLERFHTPDDTAPFGMRALWNAKASTIRIDGEMHVFIYRELPRFKPEHLTVGVHMNVQRSGTSAPMERIVFAVGAGLAVLLAAVLAAIYAGRRLSRPVQVLSRAALAARADKLAEVPHLKRSLIREFDDAARSFNSMVEGLRERALIRETLGTFLPQEIARKLLAGKGEIEPLEAKATALLCDLEAFTALTESLGPRRVVEFLNEYFDTVGEIIERHDGVITQFQGDAVLAIFNVPVPSRDHAAQAVRAAIEIIEATDTRAFAGVRVRNRIGICTGRVLAGAVGSRGHRSYTVHGNTVNLAARIEELNKDYGTRILMSGKTAERCSTLSLVRVAEVSVRGYGEPLTLFSPQAIQAKPTPQVITGS
jgi:class 3 adenylate cyclase